MSTSKIPAMFCITTVFFPRMNDDESFTLPGQEELVRLVTESLTESLRGMDGNILTVVGWTGAPITFQPQPVPVEQAPQPNPKPSPIIPTPVPVVTSGEAVAALAAIHQYANSHSLGEVVNDPFQIAPGWWGRNYKGGADTGNTLCIVIYSARHGTHLIRSGFFAQHKRENRALYGPPLEDEHGARIGDENGAEQRFEKATMRWTPKRGVWVE